MKTTNNKPIAATKGAEDIDGMIRTGSLAQLREWARARAAAEVPTGYAFPSRMHDGSVRNEELVLKPGLTFICGGKGGIKSVFVDNIVANEALRLAIGGDDGRKVAYLLLGDRMDERKRRLAAILSERLRRVDGDSTHRLGLMAKRGDCDCQDIIRDIDRLRERSRVSFVAIDGVGNIDSHLDAGMYDDEPQDMDYRREMAVRRLYTYAERNRLPIVLTDTFNSGAETPRAYDPCIACRLMHKAEAVIGISLNGRSENCLGWNVRNWDFDIDDAPVTVELRWDRETNVIHGNVTRES